MGRTGPPCMVVTSLFDLRRRRCRNFALRSSAFALRRRRRGAATVLDADFSSDADGSSLVRGSSDRMRLILLATIVVLIGGCSKSLHEAAIDGDVQRVEELLDKGADPDGLGKEPLVHSETGITAMMYATTFGHIEVVKTLLAAGADPNARSLAGRTALHEAASTGRPDFARLLLSCGAEVDARNQNGVTPLISVATQQFGEGGHAGVARVLLSSGADVNALTNGGRSAMHAAASDGWMEGVQLLLAEGASPDVRDDRGRSPLSCAAYSGQEDVAQILLTRGAQHDIFSAVCLDDLSEVLSLLEANPQLTEARGQYSGTPLWWAARLGRHEVVLLLLKNGADPNTVNRNGGTPLIQAAQGWHYGHVKVTRTLLSHGANVNSKDEDERTALHWACANNNTETVRELLRAGAHTRAEDDRGRTPTDWAHTDAIRELLRAYRSK